MYTTARVTLLAVTTLSLFGCASLPPNSKRDSRDPWERVNRTTFKVNTALDHAIARPVARGYKKVVPEPVRNSVSNFMDNLFYPVTMANDLLQLKFKGFGQDTGRFLLNTTVGVGGLFDPASQVGLQKNNEDLGQTLGYWGVKSGPYLMIPILGPSDVRDGIARVGDGFMSPLTYVDNNWIRYGIYGADVVDIRYRLLPQDHLLDESYDPYSFLRNAYLQRREYEITDGKLSDEQRRKQDQERLDEERRIIEESGGDDAKSTPPQSSGQPPEPPK